MLSVPGPPLSLHAFVPDGNSLVSRYPLAGMSSSNLPSLMQSSSFRILQHLMNTLVTLLTTRVFYLQPDCLSPFVSEYCIHFCSLSTYQSKPRMQKVPNNYIYWIPNKSKNKNITYLLAPNSATQSLFVLLWFLLYPRIHACCFQGCLQYRS